ncbi:MAG: transposase [Candidatus Thermoplasmatota archaeon]|jgi:hypothetical protein|nr:transposase [Candidatus Thermoplasmatota archaeon]MCL5253386.1 transposase [Candidatus Thermoplasmatota archaeon]
MERQDETESKQSTERKRKGKGGQSIQEKIKQLKEMREKYSGIIDEMRSTGEHEISLTDNDSRMVRCNGSVFSGYDTHAAVDSSNHPIADYTVTNKTSDGDALFDVASAAMRMLDADSIDVVADRGYYSSKEVKKCVDAGITAYVPEPDRSGNGRNLERGISAPDFYDDKFIYDRRTDTYVCPANQKLGFWTVSESRTPGMKYFVYTTKKCMSCRYLKTRCTTYDRGRRIYRWEHQNVIDDIRIRLREN